MHEFPRPSVLLIGGPNGAGKSTFVAGLPNRDTRLQRFLNADTIARGLGLESSDPLAALTAGKSMLQRMRDLARDRLDFSFEATLAGRGHASFLRALAVDAYHIDLIFIGLSSPEQSVARVAERVANGGHDINRAALRRRFTRVYSNLFHLYLPLCHRWRLFDNTDDTMVSVATGAHASIGAIHEPATFRHYVHLGGVHFGG